MRVVETTVRALGVFLLGLPTTAQYEALLDVPRAITRDMTTFTTDPAPVSTLERFQQTAQILCVQGRVNDWIQRSSSWFIQTGPIWILS